MTTERICDAEMGLACGMVRRHSRIFTRVNGIARAATKRLRAHCGGRSEGSALIEMALMLPVVMLVMTGIFGFSLLLFQQIQLTETVSSAGHYLAVARLAADPCATVYNAINTAPGLPPNPTIAITQGTTSLPTTCPINTATNPATTFLISGATVNVSVTSKSSLAVFGFSYQAFYLNSQISEIVQ
jgi:Flp pilus assembly protein TadG